MVVGVAVGLGVAVALALTAVVAYSSFWVAASAVPVCFRPFFFWNAFTALTVPLPAAPSMAPV
jgi:hypothetical protein